jgi:hypothetical protein
LDPGDLIMVAATTPRRFGNRRAALLTGLVISGLLVAGCNTTTPRKSAESARLAAAEGPAATPVQHPLLEGIPLPVGFTMNPRNSMAWESGQTRMTRCEFTGAASPEAITRFYLNYMPSARFVLKQRRLDNGDYWLRFENDTEECNILLKRGEPETVLVIDIKPLARGSAARETSPPTRRH